MSLRHLAHTTCLSGSVPPAAWRLPTHVTFPVRLITPSSPTVMCPNPSLLLDSAQNDNQKQCSCAVRAVPIAPLLLQVLLLAPLLLLEVLSPRINQQVLLPIVLLALNFAPLLLPVLLSLLLPHVRCSSRRSYCSRCSSRRSSCLRCSCRAHHARARHARARHARARHARAWHTRAQRTRAQHARAQRSRTRHAPT